MTSPIQTTSVIELFSSSEEEHEVEQKPRLRKRKWTHGKSSSSGDEEEAEAELFSDRERDVSPEEEDATALQAAVDYDLTEPPGPEHQTPKERKPVYNIWRLVSYHKE